MKKLAYLIIVMTFLSCDGFSQQIFRLYDGKAPGSEDWNYKEIEWSSPMMKGRMIRNVVDPTLEVYIPDKPAANGTAVIVCPGGGNIWLSYSSEGTDVAKRLAGKGITAFVLKYRLFKTPEDPKEFESFTAEFFKRILKPPDSGNIARSPVPLPSEKHLGAEDGIRAIEYLRAHAGEFGIDPKKVGIMGFSAGAGIVIHVIINSAPDKQPDFAASIYGGWLGDSKIPQNAPPLFILAAADDPISAGCPDLYKSWRAAEKSAELHIYSKGGHGFGMQQRGMPVDDWIERFYDWMKAGGF
jgi:acetyl esterase/lipase